MKLYFAGAEGDGPKINLPKLGVVNALVTYAAGEKTVDRVAARFPNVFLDSGAFSAFTRGERIDLDAYIAKCHSHPWDCYAALDVIGDHKATAKNAERMVEAGLNPIVAFHWGSPFSALEELCERYDRIALGGLVPYAKHRKRLAEHLDGCFAVIRNHWPKKVHAFGMQANWLLERYPLHSVDSTTWLQGHKRGKLRGKNGRLLDIGRITTREDAERAVRSNLDAAAMVADTSDRVDIYAATRHNITSLLADEQYVTKLWARRGITWED